MENSACKTWIRKKLKEMLKHRNHVYKVRIYMLQLKWKKKKLTDDDILFLNINFKKYEDIVTFLKQFVKLTVN